MFELPDLPFAYNALEPFIDEETMHLHHDGHHATYVKNVNEALTGQEQFLNMDIEKLIISLDQVPEEIRTKVKNNSGGHYHHSLFWQMLSPQKQEPPEKLAGTISKSFGDFTSFKQKFTQTAITLFGSGWTWLAFEQEKLIIINTLNQDSPLSLRQIPLLGIDLWEHAYYLKYKNKRADYIEAWWNVVNWGEVEKRFNKALSPNLAL